MHTNQRRCRSETGARCMMGRGRIHHHVTKQNGEDGSSAPTNAKNYDFMNMKSFVNAQTLAEESVACFALEEDRHRNVMGSVVLKDGVEEPWTIEEVATCIGLAERLRASNHCVQKSCDRNVQSSSHHRGGGVRKQATERTHRQHNDVATSSNYQTIKCHIESSTQEELWEDWPVLPWLVETRRLHPVHVSEKARRENAI